MISRFIKIWASAILMMTLSGCFGDSSTEVLPRFIEGEHYKILEGFERSESKQALLFFSAACPHCKKFEEVLRTWEEQKASDVAYERIPVTFNKKEWLLLSRMYAVGRQLGAQDVVVKALFKAVQVQRIWWNEDYKVIQWFGSLGFDLQAVDDLWRADSTKALMQRYIKTEGRYVIRSIPRLIINARYELLPDAFEDKDADNKEVKEMSPEVKAEISDAINYLLDLDN